MISPLHTVVELSKDSVDRDIDSASSSRRESCATSKKDLSSPVNPDSDKENRDDPPVKSHRTSTTVADILGAGSSSDDDDRFIITHDDDTTQDDTSVMIDQLESDEEVEDAGHILNDNDTYEDEDDDSDDNGSVGTKARNIVDKAITNALRRCNEMANVDVEKSVPNVTDSSTSTTNNNFSFPTSTHEDIDESANFIDIDTSCIGFGDLEIEIKETTTVTSPVLVHSVASPRSKDCSISELDKARLSTPDGSVVDGETRDGSYINHSYDKHSEEDDSEVEKEIEKKGLPHLLADAEPSFTPSSTPQNMYKHTNGGNRNDDSMNPVIAQMMALQQQSSSSPFARNSPARASMNNAGTFGTNGSRSTPPRFGSERFNRKYDDEENEAASNSNRATNNRINGSLLPTNRSPEIVTASLLKPSQIRKHMRNGTINNHHPTNNGISADDISFITTNTSTTIGNGGSGTPCIPSPPLSINSSTVSSPPPVIPRRRSTEEDDDDDDVDISRLHVVYENGDEQGDEQSSIEPPTSAFTNILKGSNILPTAQEEQDTPRNSNISNGAENAVVMSSHNFDQSPAAWTAEPPRRTPSGHHPPPHSLVFESNGPPPAPRRSRSSNAATPTPSSPMSVELASVIRLISMRPPPLPGAPGWSSSSNPAEALARLDAQGNAAAYLQHAVYMDDVAKTKTRKARGIPALVGLLSHITEWLTSGQLSALMASPYFDPSLMKLGESCLCVQKSCLGALRNLVFGDNENKRDLRDSGGLPVLSAVLNGTSPGHLDSVLSREDLSVIRELATAVLWNVSSHQSLKIDVVRFSIEPLSRVVVLPHARILDRMTNDMGGSTSLPRNEDDDLNPAIVWPSEFRNATGVLRNISSAGFEARSELRAIPGLVDALFVIVRIATQRHDTDSKPLENVMCLLQNLSYRVQEIIDPNFMATPPDLPDMLASSNGTVKPAKPNGRHTPHQYDPVQLANLPGSALWHPDVVRLYLSLLADCANPITLEAIIGSLQNLCACSWSPASLIRQAVREQRGLAKIVELLYLHSESVVRAAATALRNLALDPKNRELIGCNFLKQLIIKLPSPEDTRAGTLPAAETVCSVLATLYEIAFSNPTFAFNLARDGALPRLNFIIFPEKFDFPHVRFDHKVTRFATALLTMLWVCHKDLHSSYRSLGLNPRDFLISEKATTQPSQPTTTATVVSKPKVNVHPSSGGSKLHRDQGSIPMITSPMLPRNGGGHHHSNHVSYDGGYQNYAMMSGDTMLPMMDPRLSTTDLHQMNNTISRRTPQQAYYTADETGFNRSHQATPTSVTSPFYHHNAQQPMSTAPPYASHSFNSPPLRNDNGFSSHYATTTREGFTMRSPLPSQPEPIYAQMMKPGSPPPTIPRTTGTNGGLHPQEWPSTTSPGLVVKDIGQVGEGGSLFRKPTPKLLIHSTNDEYSHYAQLNLPPQNDNNIQNQQQQPHHPSSFSPPPPVQMRMGRGRPSSTSPPDLMTRLDDSWV